jgi:imidazoleglycerol-phosphate dehydratase
MRIAKVNRETEETRISSNINIDGTGEYRIDTPVAFFSHMLETFSKHGLFDLTFSAAGDLQVDQHHTIEDCGIVLGQSFKKALGDLKGINRAGYFILPMDEALALVAVDIGGRPYLQFDAEFRSRFCGQLETDLIEDFFQAFAVNLNANIVVKIIQGRNDHHKIEAVFKAFAKAMKMACALDPRATGKIPSTKGVL